MTDKIITQSANAILAEEVTRVKHNISGGHITPQLASAMLEHFGRALDRVAGPIEFLEACREVNPNHQATMLAYRTAKPADLKLS